MAYEIGSSEAPNEVSDLFDNDMLIARRRTVSEEIGAVSREAFALQQRYAALINESIGLNATLAARGVDTAALERELRAFPAAEDVA